MAKKDKVKQERRKARFTAFEALRSVGGFPIPPRKAMSQAKKASKTLPYPVAPYHANPIQLFRWVKFEWESLGRWQAVAAPVVTLIALLTWERELERRDARWDEIERVQQEWRATAARYAAYDMPDSREPVMKRKLLGIIPLPGGK